MCLPPRCSPEGKEAVPRIHSASRTRRGPTMSHASGGSRRVTALLTESGDEHPRPYEGRMGSRAARSQANPASACDARRDLDLGRLRGFGRTIAARGAWNARRGLDRIARHRHKTERFALPQHSNRILQHPPGNGHDRGLLTASLGDALEQCLVDRHARHGRPGGFGQHGPQMRRAAVR